MRLVLDTNVLVSALFRDGNERRVLLDCLGGQHTLVTSPFILDELGRALRETFGVPEDKVGACLGTVASRAEIVDPDRGVEATASDPGDDRVVAAALAAEADAVVTGDSDLLDVGAFRDVPMVRAADVVG